MPHTQLDIRILVTRRMLMLREAGRLTSAQVERRLEQLALQGGRCGAGSMARVALTRSGLAPASCSPMPTGMTTLPGGAARQPPGGSGAQLERRCRRCEPSRPRSPAGCSGQRATIRTGAEGRRRYTVHLRWEVTHRNQLWRADHKELPVLVLAPKARRLAKPWVTLMLDAYSRLVMGWAIAPYPSATTVLTALRMGILVDTAQGPFGRVPNELWFDGGLEFAADEVSQAAGRVGCACRWLPGYSPHLKGKVERYNRTLAEEFCGGCRSIPMGRGPPTGGCTAPTRRP